MLITIKKEEEKVSRSPILKHLNPLDLVPIEIIVAKAIEGQG